MAEIVAGDLPGGSPVFFIIAIDGFHRRYKFFWGGESEQSGARGQDIVKAGLLCDHRSPGSQVGDGAVAEPAAAQDDVLFLGHGEFAAGARDVVAVGVQIAGDFHAGADPPAVAFEQLLVCGVVAGKGQFKGLRWDFLRQVDELQKLVVFAPAQHLSVQLHFAPGLPPVADGGEGGGVPAAGVLPEFHHHGLPGGDEMELI